MQSVAKVKTISEALFCFSWIVFNWVDFCVHRQSDPTNLALDFEGLPNTSKRKSNECYFKFWLLIWTWIQSTKVSVMAIPISREGISAGTELNTSFKGRKGTTEHNTFYTKLFTSFFCLSLYDFPCKSIHLKNGPYPAFSCLFSVFFKHQYNFKTNKCDKHASI